MKLANKISIYISIAFFLLFAIISIFIYISFSNFRKVEFNERLEINAINSLNLFINKDKKSGVDNIFFNQKTYQVINEKIWIFNKEKQLLYQSSNEVLDKKYIQSIDSIQTIEEVFYLKNKEHLFCKYVKNKKDSYYLFVSAIDKYGNSKLHFLLYTLLISFSIGTIIAWVMTYLLAKKLLFPLYKFQHQITNISANNMNKMLVQNSNIIEINILTKAFNKMLNRLNKSYTSQKEFTSNASHELRTPLSRIILQIDTLLNDNTLAVHTRNYLGEMQKNTTHLNEMINSLLLLTNLNSRNIQEKLKPIRIDEVLFNAFEKVHHYYQDFQMDFSISNEHISLEIEGIESLLEIVFENMFRNAYRYSNDKKINVMISESNKNELKILLTNNGDTLNEKETEKLFSAFYRGQNVSNTMGSGLGLHIVKRILTLHNAIITYQNEQNTSNRFTIIFDK